MRKVFLLQALTVGLTKTSGCAPKITTIGTPQTNIP